MKRNSVKSAKIRAAEARANARLSLSDAKARLDPRLLTREAIDKVKAGVSGKADQLVDKARKNPGTTTAVVAAAGLFIFRKPIASALIRAIKEKRNG